MGEADEIARYLWNGWGLPLAASAGNGPSTVPEGTMGSPVEIVLRSLACGDIRLVRAIPCWLSLLEDVPPAPAHPCVEDRRRLAYLCELARALGSLRNGLRPTRSESWPAEVAGLEPSTWPSQVPLSRFFGPAVTPSAYGIKWGILEPMAFPEYVAFQDHYLSTQRLLRSGRGDT